ncbi:hypothetical protein SBOR_8233 [Sclerotinia borealis F-4128]|uniref:Uncharacterized protein n=1 Tax=Sclerotinia borealis (strain F-4128) TaxID=1432307 RepID=W9C6B0_SCLBF|nr:hypothetical protein SBOR_8233 [Sclerotinia borealis F-4128]
MAASGGLEHQDEDGLCGVGLPPIRNNAYRSPVGRRGIGETISLLFGQKFSPNASAILPRVTPKASSRTPRLPTRQGIVSTLATLHLTDDEYTVTGAKRPRFLRACKGALLAMREGYEASDGFINSAGIADVHYSDVDIGSLELGIGDVGALHIDGHDDPTEYLPVSYPRGGTTPSLPEWRNLQPMLGLGLGSGTDSHRLATAQSGFMIAEPRSSPSAGAFSSAPGGTYGGSDKFC